MPTVKCYGMDDSKVRSVMRRIVDSDVPEPVKDEIVIVPIQSESIDLLGRKAPYMEIGGSTGTLDEHVHALCLIVHEEGLDVEARWAHGTKTFYPKGQGITPYPHRE